MARIPEVKPGDQAWRFSRPNIDATPARRAAASKRYPQWVTLAAEGETVSRLREDDESRSV